MAEKEQDDFSIEPQKVHARGDSAAKLFGWTFSEIGTMLAVIFGTLLIFRNNYVTISAGALTYFYLKHLKTQLPERWFAGLMKHYLFRKDFLYRSGGRDKEWRPPIKVDEEQKKKKTQQQRRRR